MVLTTSTEPQPWVVRGGTLEKCQGNLSAVELLDPVPDEGASKPLPLVLWDHTHGAQYLDIDVPLRGVKQVPCGQHVSNDFIVLESNERQSLF